MRWKSEEKYRAIVDQSIEMIYLHDQGGNIQDVNKAAVEQVGYSQGELLAMTVFDLHQDKSGREEILEQWRSWSPGQSVTLETKHRRKDGTLFPVEITTGKILLGGKEHILAFVRDITERQQTEEALRYSEEKFRQMADNMAEVFWLRSADNNQMLYISPAYEKIWGRSCQSLYDNPDSFIESVYPPDLPAVIQEFAYEKETGGIFNLEYRILRPDGGIRWVWARSFPVKDLRGKIIRHTGIAVDITRRKQVEEALNYQLEFEKIISQVSSTFVTLSPDKFDRGIDQALRLTGEFFQADRSYVFQFSPGGDTLSNTHEWCAEGIGSQKGSVQDEPVSNFPYLVSLYNTREYVYISQVSSMPEGARSEKKILQGQGIQSLLNVPMLRGGKVIGFFGFDSVKEKKSWDLDQVPLLKVIAEILVNALDRQEAGRKIHEYTLELELKGIELEELYCRLDRQVDKVWLIHQRTLPAVLPEVEGLSLAAHYYPNQKLGGDFYNVIKKGDRLVLYLSDVMGHGMEGAMLSVFVKEALDSYIALRPEGMTPEKMLKHLDRQYRQNVFPDDYFICIFLAVLDLKTMELSYAGAGFQELPLVINGDGSVGVLEIGGLPVSSAFPEGLMEFTPGKRVLSPGTAIFFTTDGLMEQAVGHEKYGSRLPGVFRASASLDPEEIVQAVNRDFRSLNQGSLQGKDDITFVVLKVHG